MYIEATAGTGKLVQEFMVVDGNNGTQRAGVLLSLSFLKDQKFHKQDVVALCCAVLCLVHLVSISSLSPLVFILFGFLMC